MAAGSAKPFGGTIGKTAASSRPWWPSAAKPPAGAPNILVVLFDNRTTLGLVRLKMKLVVEELTQLFQQVFARGTAGQEARPNILAGADDEIDKLFQ